MDPLLLLPLLRLRAAVRTLSSSLKLSRLPHPSYLRQPSVPLPLELKWRTIPFLQTTTTGTMSRRKTRMTAARTSLTPQEILATSSRNSYLVASFHHPGLSPQPQVALPSRRSLRAPRPLLLRRLRHLRLRWRIISPSHLRLRPLHRLPVHHRPLLPSPHLRPVEIVAPCSARSRWARLSGRHRPTIVAALQAQARSLETPHLPSTFTSRLNPARLLPKRIIRYLNHQRWMLPRGAATGSPSIGMLGWLLTARRCSACPLSHYRLLWKRRSHLLL